MKTQQNKSIETRRRLIHAGLKVFSEKGFSAARIEDVARAAGLTRGAFYWHFRYKLELFQGIFSEMLEQLHAETQNLLHAKVTPHEALRSFILHIPTRIIEDERFYAFGKLRYKIEWTDGLEEAVIAPFLEKQAKDNNRMLVCLFKEGKAAGSFRRDLATPVLVTMTELFALGLIHHVLDGESSSIREGELQLISDGFLASISTPG